MATEDLIKALKQSNIYAECNCGEEFKLSKALLFDGTRPFPEAAIKIQKELIEELEEQENNLKKKEQLVRVKAEITTKAVNIGKQFEKILPLMKDFKWQLSDCRFLGDPIDMITFNGLTNGQIESISFIEVKSGKARLNEHQKAIKTAIDDNCVSFKVFE